MKTFNNLIDLMLWVSEMLLKHEGKFYKDFKGMRTEFAYQFLLSFEYGCDGIINHTYN